MPTCLIVKLGLDISPAVAVQCRPRFAWRWSAAVLSIRSKLIPCLLPLLRKHPRLKASLTALDGSADRMRHRAAAVVPQVIRPDPREIYITLTSNCNLRCIGCRYGRDFMPGAQLSWPVVRQVLDDCSRLGIRNVRFYGGEPLLHHDLCRMIEHAAGLGLNPWITTNGMLLREKIDDLYRAGLRTVDIGFYGTGDEYDAYVQRRERYVRLEAAIAYVRDRYGVGITLRLGWVLMRPTCNLKAVHSAWQFAERYLTPIGVSLIHYSLPYFSEGPDRELQFRPEDRAAIEEVVAELIRLKRARPDLLRQPVMALRSIPDWLLKGPAMKVPCDRYRMIWVGADGTVQMCYVTFKLGNLHERRLSEMLFTPAHERASRDAFALKCPNCHCSYPERIALDAPSRRKYSSAAVAEA